MWQIALQRYQGRVFLVATENRKQIGSFVVLGLIGGWLGIFVASHTALQSLMGLLVCTTHKPIKELKPLRVAGQAGQRGPSLLWWAAFRQAIWVDNDVEPTSQLLCAKAQYLPLLFMTAIEIHIMTQVSRYCLEFFFVNFFTSLPMILSALLSLSHILFQKPSMTAAT